MRRAARSLALYAAMAAVALALFLAWPRRLVRVHSTLTGKWYLVRNDAERGQAVADRLALLELRVRRFLHRAQEYAPGDPRLLNIQARWNGSLAETEQDADVAYSVGKDAISLCVRAPDGSLESENTSMFVLLHELAHVATNTYGHKPEFWANMRFLLELAEATGTYTYQDFDATKTTYCGRALAASPLTCVKSGKCRSELGPR